VDLYLSNEEETQTVTLHCPPSTSTSLEMTAT
jgi:hypothetical protein